MTDREAEGPLDLQDAIEKAEESRSGLWLDLHPPTDWHDCLACGTWLYGQSLFHTNDDVLAVAYSCPQTECLARWIWETVTDELYYQGDAEISRLDVSNE